MKTIKNVVFSLITLLLFAFIAEITLKALGFPAILIDSKVNALIECREETDAYYRKYNFNRLGLRGKKEILAKQNDVYRIVCIGDSWTFGLNVPEDKTYPADLEVFLKESVPEMKIEVVNAGLPGNRVEELICFLRNNINLLNPDCIIFLGGMNGIAADKVKNPWKNRYLRFYTSKIGLCLSKSRLYNVLENLELDLGGIIQYFKKEATREEMVVVSAAGFLDRLQKEGKVIILLNYPLPKISKTIPYNVYQGYGNRSINKMLKYFLKENSNFVFIDLYDIFRKNEDCDNLFLKMYYTHPNEDGYSVISKAIGAYLGKKIFLEKE